ncbi:MAG TPA: DNA recombination protein RmuC, partial [Clostridiales bacterium]|nr:DNA recombination protein RmuC [Clostridiales bacterium]
MEYLILGIIIGFLIGMLFMYVLVYHKKYKIEKELVKIQFDLQQAEERESKIKEIEKNFEENFKNLANEILDKKMSQMYKLNENELINVLKPLEKDLKDFRDKADITHKESLEKNASLVEKILNLEKVGLNISEEANKLTKALKSENKTQGTWGEIILERILEESGLRLGIEYLTQGVGMDIRDEDNYKLKPDFIIKLPNDKHIIVDSKVSIKYYEKYMNSETEEIKTQMLKALLDSLKTHITSLESKHYERREGINSPDFVLMFIPFDNIFNIMSSTENDIVRYSWNKKIGIVTPMTLMYTLWLISYIWKQENQSKNVLEIAKKSGEMYDKFATFLETISDIGKQIDKSKELYDKAINQLSTGKGNLMKRADDIKNLGADNKKVIE